MKLPSDYEKTQAADGQGGKQLPAGGYVCQIKGASEETTNNGAPILRLLIDIFEGDYKGYFQERYERDRANVSSGNAARWRGRYDTFVLTKEGKTNPFFKGLITAVEKSNPNATLIIQEELHPEFMKNCVVGLLFREEEFLGQDDEVHISVRPSMAIDAARIRSGDFKIPEPRLLSADKKAKAAGFTEIPVDNDDELPF